MEQLEQDTQKNTNRISELEQVKDHEMYFESQKVKYTGELLNGKMSQKGTVRCLDNTQKEAYEGEVYHGKKHGIGTDIKKEKKGGDHTITKDKGNFKWGEKHGHFTKTYLMKKSGQEIEQFKELQIFSNGVSHAYSIIEKPDGSKVHQFDEKYLDDKEVYLSLTFENDGSVILNQNVTQKIEEEIDITPALSSTEKKNGEEMDDK